MDNTITTLKQIKINALYGKKKHFNAADRKRHYHCYIGITLIILNVITGSVLFYVLTDCHNNGVKYIPLILAILASVLSALQTFFNFQKTVEGHMRVGNRYLAVMKKCVRLNAYIADTIIAHDDIAEKIETLASEIDGINQEAESLPTNPADYEKARQGIQEGEEEYRQDELNL